MWFGLGINPKTKTWPKHAIQSRKIKSHNSLKTYRNQKIFSTKGGKTDPNWTPQHTSITTAISASMLLGDFLFCRLWMLEKNPRSKTFRSGLFAGCCLIVMSHPSRCPSSMTSLSLLYPCGRALSCCTLIVALLFLDGIFSRITGNNFLITMSLTICFVT